MANKYSNDKIDAAKLLYKQGYEQYRISQILGVAEKTIRLWKEKYQWDETFGKWETVEQNVLDLILYQSMALRKKKERLLKDAEDTDEPKLLDRGDIDALQKMSTIFRNEIKDFSAYSKAVQELVKFISEQNIDTAKMLIPYVDAFLQLKQKSFQ